MIGLKGRTKFLKRVHKFLKRIRIGLRRAYQLRTICNFLFDTAHYDPLLIPPRSLPPSPIITPLHMLFRCPLIGTSALKVYLLDRLDVVRAVTDQPGRGWHGTVADLLDDFLGCQF